MARLRLRPHTRAQGRKLTIAALALLAVADSTLVKVASAYEAATHHRKPPPAFGPLKQRGRD